MLLEKDDPQRFVWLGRAAVNGDSFLFLNEMVKQIHNFNSGTGHANVAFVIGRALEGQIDNEKRTLFGNPKWFDTFIGPANQAFRFYEFQSIVSKSSRQLDNYWAEKQGCERHPKDDWEDDLGCERSSIFGREIIGQTCSRREEGSV